MRKSILLTVFAVFWAMAAFGQTTDANPTPLQQTGCNEDENFPAVGVPHEYEVQISGSTYTGDGNFKWYVTQNAGNLLTETGAIAGTNNYFDVDSGAGLSAYNATTGTTEKIGLTWKSGALLNTNLKYFLVVKYSDDTGGCASNMKVMKIEPLNQFKLNIDPVKDVAGTAFGSSASVCAADVDGASYDASTNSITYTYGENTLYYKVKASGFAGKWKPQISLPALSTTGDQKYVSAQWSSDNGGTWHNFTTLAADGSAQTLTSTDLATIPTVASGSTPSATYIYKVVIDNEKYETLADQTLNIGTDGTYGGTNNDQLNDKTDDCSADESTFGDNDDYTIKARPTIKANSGGFIQKVN